MSAKICTMTDLQPISATGPKGHHQAQVPFAPTHRHNDSTSFYGLSLIASHRHHSMEAILRPDCRICYGVRKALHKDSNSSVEGAPSSRRSFATRPLPNTCLRNSFRFCWCAMRRPCRELVFVCTHVNHHHDHPILSHHHHHDHHLHHHHHHHQACHHHHHH